MKMLFKDKKKLKILILLTLLTGIISILNLSLFVTNLYDDSIAYERFPFFDDATRISANHAPIHIDGDWSAAKAAGICTGSGTYNDPYIIENFEIDGGGSGNCITIENSNEYFVIRNCTAYNSGSGWWDAGIKLNNLQNGKIINNTASGNNCGIYLYNSSNNIVSENSANNNFRGIWLHFSYNNTIAENIANNNDVGISLYPSHNNTIIKNLMEGCGIQIFGSLEEMSSNTIDTTNLVNENPVYYYANKTGLEPNNFSNAGQVILVNCNDSLISNLNIFHSTYGISLFYCENNTILNNTANQNHYGIYLSYSNNNTISGNTANDNRYGKYLSYDDFLGISLWNSDNNIISGNTANHNGKYGISLFSSCNNNISGNFININKIGIYFKYYSHNNIISENIIISENYIGQSDYGIYLNYNNKNTTVKKNLMKNSGIKIAGSVEDVSSHFISTTNLVNGKPVYYYANKIGLGKNNFTNAGQVILANCSDSLISDLNVSYGCTGISLHYCENNTILNNTVNYNRIFGIFLIGSNNNTISGNTANNNRNGIYLSENNYNNTILGNILNDNIYWGIFLRYSNYNIFSENSANNNFIGIYLIGSNNNTISRNIANNNDDYGIYLFNSNKNTISENILNGNDVCIREDNCEGNIIENNICSGYWILSPIVIDGDATGVGAHNWTWAVNQPWCSGSGTWKEPYIIKNVSINGQNSSNCLEIGNSSVFFIIENCNFFNSTNSIYLSYVGNGTIVENNCTNNSQGISLYNSDNNTIMGNNCSFNRHDGIYFWESNNNTITGNNCSFNLYNGIDLWYSHNNTVERNNCSRNDWNGINLSNSAHNIIIKNICKQNDMNGIYFPNADYNIVIENDCSMNHWTGLAMKASQNNTITGNSFINNQQGISISFYSKDNNIFNNIFINNGNNAGIYGETTNNKWDNGTLGNYWDDYIGKDANDNGIGDTPYNISGSAESQDRYPIWWDSPVLSVISPSENELFGVSSPNFNISIDEGIADIMWYTLDNGLANYTFTKNDTINQAAWFGFGNGTLTIIFYANDSRGYIGSMEVVIRKDIIAPQITVNSPNQNEVFGSGAPNFDLTIMEGNLDKTWYSLNGGQNYTFSGTSGAINQVAWDACENGPVIIRFYANDSLGNKGYAEVTIFKDIIAPNITINSPNQNEVFGNGAPNFDLTIVEGNLDKTWYSLNGGQNYTFSGTSGTINQAAWDALADGSLTIQFYANDSLSNEGYAEVTIFKDVTNPTLTHPADVAYDEGDTGNEIAWTAIDLNPATYSITKNGVEIESGNWVDGQTFTVDVDGLSYGTYTYVITVYDVGGNFATDTVIVTVGDGTNPTLTHPADIVYNEGETGNAITWTANDLNPTTYSITKDGTEIESGNWVDGQTFTVDVDGLSYGTYTYVITAYDVDGNFAMDSITVSVGDGNNPTLTHPADIAYNEGETGNAITWMANDLNPATYSITKDGTEIEAGNWIDGQTFTVDVDGLSYGTYTYVITAYDVGGNFATDTVIVTVGDGNNPTLTHPADIVYNEGETGNAIAWTANDLNPTTYSITKDGTEIEAGNWVDGQTFTVDVDGLSYGTYTYVITAYDVDGNFAMDSITVSVGDGNNPTLTHPADIAYNEGETGNAITWMANDLNPATYSITKDGTEIEAGNWVDGQTFTVDIDGLSYGTYTYVITAYDADSNFAMDSITVSVGDGNNPTLTHPADIVYNEGDTGNAITWTANDLNPTTYSITKDGTEVDSGNWVDGQTFTVDVDGLSYGTYTYVITAYDVGGNFATDTVIVTVGDGNNPTLTHPADIVYNEGETGNAIAWTANDLNPTTYSITKDGTEIEAGNWVDGQTFTVDVDGLSYGTYTYVITVYDADSNFATDTVIVTVGDGNNPTLTHPADIVYNEGETGNAIAWTANDLNPATYSITKDGTEIEAGNWVDGQTFTVDVDGLFYGTYTYVITVYDADSNFATDTVIVTVNEVIEDDTDNPIISEPEDVYYEAGEEGNSITWVATDANPDYYDLYIDGVLIISEDWESGVDIVVNVDGLENGTYKYTITVYDKTGNSASDTVEVKVTGISGGNNGIPGYELEVMVLVSLFAVIFLIKKKKNKLHHYK